MAQSLALGEFSVRQLDGLFSLNDLHTAAGGEAKHLPNRFMRLDSTVALAAEIGQTPEMAFATKTLHGGTNPGTYACRELVIAYAAWISAAFHLKVIRVFLAQETPAQPAPQAPTLQNRRWLISYDHTGREVVTPIAASAAVIDPTTRGGLFALLYEVLPHAMVPVALEVLQQRIATNYQAFTTPKPATPKPATLTQRVAQAVGPLDQSAGNMRAFAREVGLHETSAKKLIGTLNRKGLLS